MGKTIIEKIFSKATLQSSVTAGDYVVCDVGTIVLLDTSFFPMDWRVPTKVHNPDRVVVVFDHRVPAPDEESAAAHNVGREFVRKFRIKRFHDVGPRQGISHAIVAENAYALPGTILVCGDSHACSGGAFNCAARGVGDADITHALVTGETWFRVPPTVRYELHGRLNSFASAKDVFLCIAGKYGAHANVSVEFGGPGLANLNIDERRTLSTMGAELSADFTIFEGDGRLDHHMRERGHGSLEWTNPDHDASYQDVRQIDLSAIEPQIAHPDAIVNNTTPLQMAIGKKITRAFIGSCANGNLSDLANAADVIRGHRVADGVQLIVTPASQEIYRQALKAGYIEAFIDAGAIVTNATCGACGGGHMGVLGPNEVCITASTRNFKGRMGHPSAQIYMASPAAVAASAVRGEISEPWVRR